MKSLRNYTGIAPFTVLVDESSELSNLIEQARKVQGLPFSQKLDAVKQLSLNAMENAYERWQVAKENLASPVKLPQHLEDKVWASDRPDSLPEIKQAADNIRKAQQAEHDKYRGIVFQKHPLSFALQQKAGCCRYQGALFFVLAYEANLGDKHFIQAAPVNRNVNSVFNQIVHNRILTTVSIFKESLKDKRFDYSVQNPQVFAQAFEKVPGLNMYSYHRTPSGLIIAENPETHVKDIKV